MTDTFTIATNHHVRPVLDAYELTPAQRVEFDYLDWTAIEAGTDSASFFRYRGQLYDLSEFMRVDYTVGSLAGWDGYQSDSFFSGLVVKYSELDGDTYGSGVIVGIYSA